MSKKTIKPIKKDGIASIESLIKMHMKKARRANEHKDEVYGKINKDIAKNLAIRLKLIRKQMKRLGLWEK